MTNPPAYSDRQLRTFEVLERNRMAWLAFYVVIGTFIFLTLVWVYAVFFRNDVANELKWALSLGNGILALALHRIVRFLFPKKHDLTP